LVFMCVFLFHHPMPGGAPVRLVRGT
jgi:hypothetical protein